ncbi:MAG TPA: PAS domain-containing protein [Vicinamibacterales bacterium]|nr:PAS domain-containing protein [Vicinamibacterales bacterium]
MPAKRLRLPETSTAGSRTRTQRDADAPQSDVVRRLEAALKSTRRRHGVLARQLKSNSKELKAATAQVGSMSEELRATNARLEDSTSQLHAVNAELSTVNDRLRENIRELVSRNDDLANLLAVTDVAAVFVDQHMCISRWTMAAMRLFNLLPFDIGRPLGDVITSIPDINLTVEAETVLRTRGLAERSVRADQGRQFVLRMLPYTSERGEPQGVVVTFTEVTALKASEQELRLLNRTLEEHIRDRTRHLLLLHDVARTISDASNWDDALHGILRCICAAEKWQVGSIYLPAEGEPGSLAPVITHLEGEPFSAFGRGTPGRLSRGDGVPGRVYADGKPIWIGDQEALIRLHPSKREVIRQLGLKSAVVVPLSVRGETIAVLELLSTTAQRAGSEVTHLIADVGAQISGVIDRERTMSQAAALVWREQQSLVHTLHDSIGQQLTAIGMLSTGLSKRLGEGDTDVVEVVNEIARQARESLDQVRRLSRGLFPVEIDATGLAHALRRLVSTTTPLSGIRCTVEETGRVFVRDNRIATELYRIAQEAVSNALKHANANSIIVRLAAEPGTTILTVSDDGHGLQPRRREDQGVGLRIMRYRAQSIGASLTIESAPNEGTVVTCLLRDTPHQAIPPLKEGPVL